MNLDFVKDDYRFNARASAIIYNSDKTKLLVFKIDDDRDYFLLPGGRIEMNEDSTTAIKREILEELGIELDFNLCSIEEIFINKNGKNIMQYCFCYKAIFKDKIEKDIFKCLDNSNQLFYWVNIDNLDNIKIYPESCKDLIKNNYQNIKHIVEKNINLSK